MGSVDIVPGLLGVEVKHELGFRTQMPLLALKVAENDVVCTIPRVQVLPDLFSYIDIIEVQCYVSFEPPVAPAARLSVLVQQQLLVLNDSRTTVQDTRLVGLCQGQLR